MPNRGRPDRINAVVSATDDRTRSRAFESLVTMDEERLAATLESRPPEVLLQLVETATEVDTNTACAFCRIVVERGGERIDLSTVVDRVLELSDPDAVDVALEAYRRGDGEERVSIARSLNGQLTPHVAWALLSAAEADLVTQDPETIESGATDRVDDGVSQERQEHTDRLRTTFREGAGVSRRAAALGLGTVGTDRSIQPLLESLEGGSLARRRDAIAGLSLAPLEPAAGPLARSCHDEDLVAEASETLRDALDRLEWDEYLVDSVGRTIVDALVAVTDRRIRSTLVHAVHKGVQAEVYRENDEVFALLERADECLDPDARAEAATLLALTGRSAAIDAILSLFDDPQPDVRAAAAASVTKVGADLSRRFSALLQGTDAYRTSRAYGALDASEAVEPLVELLDDDAPGVRHTAATALGEAGAAGAVGPLAKLLDADPDPAVRRAAADALGRIGDSRAIQPLELAIDDEEETVRRTAVIATGNPAFDRSDELVDLLHEHDEASLRGAAATALAHQVRGLALGPLCRALRTESNSDVRATIADALRTLDDPAAVPVLEAERASAEDAARDAIELALDELDDGSS